MTDYIIISGVILPPKVRGPKKGRLRFDNSQLVHEAAVEVIAGRCKCATDAARLLKDRFISNGADQSKITMFVRKINVEIAKIKSDTMLNIQR